MKKIIALFALTLAFQSTGFSQKLKATDRTQNAGKVEWVQRQIDLGEIKQGEPQTAVFEVKNISKKKLSLIKVAPSCTCTTVKFSQQDVKPGETTEIIATFDAAKVGAFHRFISVTTNFDEAEPVALILKGQVVPKHVINLNQPPAKKAEEGDQE
ncbi:MAG: DUF1573 domain-containing protein [Saprospiraceae bacterium]